MNIVTLTGQLLNTRPLSSRLAFADLRLTASAASTSSGDIAGQSTDSSNGEILNRYPDEEVVELVFKARHGSDNVSSATPTIYGEAAAPSREKGESTPSIENYTATAVGATLEHLYVSSVPLALKAVCVGDVVQVLGMWENAPSNALDRKIRTLRCCEAPLMLHSWASTSGGVPFVPVYVSRAEAAAAEVVGAKDDTCSETSMSTTQTSATGVEETSLPNHSKGSSLAPPSATKEVTSTADSGICKFFVNTGR